MTKPKKLSEGVTGATSGDASKPSILEVMVIELLTDAGDPVKVAVERTEGDDSDASVALTVFGPSKAIVRMNADSVNTLVQALELATTGLLQESSKDDDEGVW